MTDNEENEREENNSEENGGEKSPAEISEPGGGPLGRLKAFMQIRFPEAGEAEAEAETEGEQEGFGAAITREIEPAEVAEEEVEEAAAEEEPEEAEERPSFAEFRKERVRQYRKRQRKALEEQAEKMDEDDDTATDGGESVVVPEAPQPPPANNWVPLGPSIVSQGQAAGGPAVSGRIADVAVTPGASRIYVASANGGIWYSENRGKSWISTMEAWDLNPSTHSSDSLACGAIAIDPSDPDRVYVGTGEGATSFEFGGEVRTTSYFGVGPIRTDDGGENWYTEPAAPGSPTLSAHGFYELAVDPTDRERVVAATTAGIYRREPDGDGEYHWVRTRSGRHTSVVVTQQGTTTTFYAARWGGEIVRSSDGESWSSADGGFPSSNVGRVGLAVAPSDLSVVYTLVANANPDSARGVWRFDADDAVEWRQVTGYPSNLFGPSGGPTQGSYDLAITVDPTDPDRIYLGGSGMVVGESWVSAIFRCDVSSSGDGSGRSYDMSTEHIGTDVHADVHVLQFTPNSGDELWVGCDGGMFYSGNVTGAADFEHRNTGLATLTMMHLGQHPMEDAVVFCGTQDNGGLRFVGEEDWLHVAPGDGGYCVVNWDDPYKVLITYPMYRSIFKFTDGGNRYKFGNVRLETEDPVLFYSPLVGTPQNSSEPDEADRVAIGTTRPWISDQFGGNWHSLPDGTESDRLPSATGWTPIVTALAFASYEMLYVATLDGQVYRYEESSANGGADWIRTRIDDDRGTPLPHRLPITDIAVDPADPSGESVWVVYGGYPALAPDRFDYRRVWHFDGTTWEQRSGPAPDDPDSLLNVHCNAIVVDPENPNELYVGADLGVWRSTDAGETWTPFSFGLPDAAVMDLKLHAERRLLRASTHGRGVWEFDLSTATKPGVELYVRDTPLDLGRFPTEKGRPHPTEKGNVVSHDESPDIKLDVPDATGRHQFPPTDELDFHQFVDELVDDAGKVPKQEGAILTTHAYVQIHNRGVTLANDVWVTLLLANADGGVPPFPSGHGVDIRNGMPLSTGEWQTVGTQVLHDVRVGVPKVAQFELRSDRFEATSDAGDEYYLVAVVHHPSDPYSSSETDVNDNTTVNRKVAQQRLRVVELPPAADTWPTYERGDSGKDVTSIQHLLRAHGHTLGVDGVFGPQTENRVRQFQLSNDLVANGVVDPNTWVKLIFTVKLGASGHAVRAVQDQLGITVDGIFGGRTKAAVEEFQSDHGLVVDGIVGPITWRTLIAA